jgi:hypothetical protein
MNETFKNKILNNNKSLIYIIFVIFLGIFYRLIPHVPNFSLYKGMIFNYLAFLSYSIFSYFIFNKYNKLINYQKLF